MLNMGCPKPSISAAYYVDSLKQIFIGLWSSGMNFNLKTADPLPQTDSCSERFLYMNTLILTSFLVYLKDTEAGL